MDLLKKHLDHPGDGASHRRRDHRARRVDTMRSWRDGREVDDAPGKERWSREARTGRHRAAAKNSALGNLVLAGEGLVVEHHRRSCVVRTDAGEEFLCRYGASLEGNEEGNGIVVGDRVAYGRDEASGELYLSRLFPRSSKLSRPGPPDREHREQLLAANVDRLVVVTSAAEPDFRPGFVDRYMLVASWSDLPMALVVNKIDLVESLPEAVSEFEGLVDEIVPVSTRTGEGLDRLRALVKGRRSVFTGHSGVGKSSLVEKLVPGLSLKTGDVREDGKGRHTTTSSSVYELPEGGSVIDTPGIRGLGIWKADPALVPLLFPPFKPYVNRCRFDNCRHLEEPGCAVEAAFESGKIPLRFRKGYRRILEGLERP